MKLGIDFGTTRIVIARADRGNYPILAVEGPDEESRDYIPALIAAGWGEIRYGWDAWAVAGMPGWTLTRSLKRLLDSAGPATRVDLGPVQLPLLDVLTDLARTAWKAARRESADEPLQAFVGVPANANTNQRYLTSEAFQRAGFEVLGLLNEPSAAGVEFGHANARKGSGDELLLIYDLGGGTFDASLVQVRGGEHDVISTEGIGTLGGDDFDQILADLALPESESTQLTQVERFHLLEHCREAKEALNPNSRRIILDLESVRPGFGTATISTAEYYDKCRPAVDETLAAVDDLIAQGGDKSPDWLYITGGGSELPLVSRMLRERFSRRVKRSSYTRAATAIGLAIHADGQAGFSLRERFTRFFGVWREAEGGREIIFDPVFAKGTTLPGAADPPIMRERTYRPVHNIGHFRYLEASSIDDDGRPAGAITLWDEIRFPLDPAIPMDSDLSRIPIEQSNQAAGQAIVETWFCDANGVVEVELQNKSAGYRRRYRLGRWNAAAESSVSAKPRRKRVGA